MSDRKEYIERGALMAEIRATPWSDYVGSYYGRSLHFDINEIVERQPDADVEEVVRCPECKFIEEREDPITGDTLMICRYRTFPARVTPSDYCSHGERKDGADNAAD